MTYPQPHIYLRALGHFGASGAPLDHWSVGLRFGIVGSPVPYDAADLQSFVDVAGPLFTAFHQAGATAAGTNCFLTELTAARVGVDGKYDPPTQETVRNELGSPVAGTGSGVHPWNTASVISLRTFRPRGYASNGRMYYPCLALGVTPASGRVAGSAITNRLTAAKTLFDGLNLASQAYAPDCRLIVASAVGTGLAAWVTSIRADGRLDSIERRENEQPTSWQTAELI